MSGHVDHLLQDYIDDALAADERLGVERHLDVCPRCRMEHANLTALLVNIQSLPRSIEPERDLWSGIDHRIKETTLSKADLSQNGRAQREPARLRSVAIWLTAAAAAVAAVSVGINLYLSQPSWDVVILQGSPVIAERHIEGEAKLRRGEWLETDESSRARLDVGVIGHVDVAPRTAIQIRSTESTDHRIALARGTIEASIFAPPRLFFVETPSATAIDLGCVYSLSVDSAGTSLLHVKAGYVELADGGRVSVVPAGWMCLARPGRGPGTAFSAAASSRLRDELRKYDFEDGPLDAVLASTGSNDGVTLWQLFEKAEGEDRERIYDRLTSLMESPKGITREGVLSSDPVMIAAWQERLGLNMYSWRDYLKKKTSMSAP